VLAVLAAEEGLRLVRLAMVVVPAQTQPLLPVAGRHWLAVADWGLPGRM
jgi:hypothetical protein